MELDRSYDLSHSGNSMSFHGRRMIGQTNCVGLRYVLSDCLHCFQSVPTSAVQMRLQGHVQVSVAIAVTAGRCQRWIRLFHASYVHNSTFRSTAQVPIDGQIFEVLPVFLSDLA